MATDPLTDLIDHLAGIARSIGEGEGTPDLGTARIMVRHALDESDHPAAAEVRAAYYGETEALHEMIHENVLMVAARKATERTIDLPADWRG